MDDWDDFQEHDCLVETGGRRVPGSCDGFSGVFKRWGLKPELLWGVVLRLYYSRWTPFLHAATFLLAGALLATSLGLATPLQGRPCTSIVLEVVVTLSLVLEVCLRAATLGREAYMSSWSNMLDVLIATVSAGFLFLATPLARFRETRAEDTELSQSLVMLRIVVQFARLLVIAEHTQHARKMTDGSYDIRMNSPLDDLSFDFSLLREQALQERNRGDGDGL